MKNRIYKIMSFFAITTTIITVVVILCIFNYLFNKQMSQEIRNETLYLANMLNCSKNNVACLKNLDKKIDTRISLISKDGKVYFDNKIALDELDNHLSRKEISSAFEKGVGEKARLSNTLGSKTFYYAILLKNGDVLRLANTTDSIYATFLRLFTLIICIVSMEFILALYFADRLTKKIIDPINELNLEKPLENVIDDELSPLIYRIDKQNRLIYKQMNQMRKQKEQFDIITKHMEEGLIVLDKEGTILSINNSALKLLTVDSWEYENKNILVLNRSLQMQSVVEKAKKGESSSDLLHVNDLNLEILSSPVYDKGEIIGLILLILDVTEKQKGEQMRREFSANVSHELKTPITSISGYAELMKNGMVKDEDIIVFADKIYQESKRLITLVEDIIKISKLDEKNIFEQKESVDLYEIAKDVIERLKAVAHQLNVTVTLKGQVAFLSAIPQMMNELCYNLVENALKYNKSGGTVTVEILLEKENVILTISDTGIGIDKEDISHVFERFYRVDKSHSKQTGGTGLGLSIVKHIVEYHKGNIDIESKINYGTKIKIMLPRMS